MKPRQPSIIEKVPTPAGNLKDKGTMGDIMYFGRLSVLFQKGVFELIISGYKIAGYNKG